MQADPGMHQDFPNSVSCGGGGGAVRLLAAHFACLICASLDPHSGLFLEVHTTLGKAEGLEQGWQVTLSGVENDTCSESCEAPGTLGGTSHGTAGCASVNRSQHTACLRE